VQVDAGAAGTGVAGHHDGLDLVGHHVCRRRDGDALAGGDPGQGEQRDDASAERTESPTGIVGQGLADLRDPRAFGAVESARKSHPLPK
jgi:hypothetical protein